MQKCVKNDENLEWLVFQTADVHWNKSRCTTKILKKAENIGSNSDKITDALALLEEMKKDPWTLQCYTENGNLVKLFFSMLEMIERYREFF